MSNFFGTVVGEINSFDLGFVLSLQELDIDTIEELCDISFNSYEDGKLFLEEHCEMARNDVDVLSSFIDFGDLDIANFTHSELELEEVEDGILILTGLVFYTGKIPFEIYDFKSKGSKESRLGKMIETDLFGFIKRNKKRGFDLGDFGMYEEHIGEATVFSASFSEDEDENEDNDDLEFMDGNNG